MMKTPQLSFEVVVVMTLISTVFPESVALTLNGSFLRDAELDGNFSFYYVNQNSASWSAAVTDCKACLGETGTLAYIETETELSAVTRFLLESGDTVSRLWVGGLFNVTSQKFVWGNGVTLESWAPWAAGHPNTRTSLSKILTTTVGAVKFETDFQTKSHRYLCEAKMQPLKIGNPCNG